MEQRPAGRILKRRKMKPLSSIIGRIRGLAKKPSSREKKREFHLARKQPGMRARGFVDDAARISSDGIFRRGWFVHTDTGIHECAVVSAEGRRVTVPFGRTVMKRPVRIAA